MFLHKYKAVYAASERKRSASGEVQVRWGSIHEWQKAEEGDRCTDC